MSTSTKSLRLRSMTAAAGLAVLGATGAGLASGASAASSSAGASTTLAKIKYCESGGNYQAVNKSSGASGAYQFLNSTWRGLSASSGYATAASAPASVQDAAALELYHQAGTSPWAASSGCWSKLGGVPSSATNATTSTSSATTKTTSVSASKASFATSSRAHAIKPVPAHGRPQQAPKKAELGKPVPGKHHAHPGAHTPHHPKAPAPRA